MNSNEFMLYNIYAQLYKQLINEHWVTDKSGVKLVEIIACNFQFDPSLGHHLKVVNPNTGYVFKQTNEEYVELQTKWHQSMQLNIDMVKHVKIWQDVSSSQGEVNSNYGWCVFHPQNGSDGKSQFQHVVDTLSRHKQSRQALIIYTRPSMHTDSKRDGMSDFLCTISNQFFIRDDKLHMIYNMKGQDGVFGIYHNYPWSCYVYNMMLERLRVKYPELETGSIKFFVGSFHIYERHFKKLKRLFEKSTPLRVVQV